MRHRDALRWRDGAPMSVALFAALRIRDLTAARAWYERLLGEPAFFPNATEVVWSLADDRFLYIEQDPGRAGSGLVTVFVDDLEARIAEIGARGLEPAKHETYANGVRKMIYRDDDGKTRGGTLARPGRISSTRGPDVAHARRRRRDRAGARPRQRPPLLR